MSKPPHSDDKVVARLLKRGWDSFTATGPNLEPPSAEWPERMRHLYPPGSCERVGTPPDLSDLFPSKGGMPKDQKRKN